MYITEWEYIKKHVEILLPPIVKVEYQGHISEELTPPHKAYNEAGEIYLLHDDSDYNAGSVLSILVGPFKFKHHGEVNECLTKCQDKLGEMGYAVQDAPFGEARDGQVSYIIRFKRTEMASLHLL